jgi:hypothetical protein
MDFKIFFKRYKFYLNISIFAILLGVGLFFGASWLVKKIKTTADLIQERIIDDEINQMRIAKIPEMESVQQLFNEKESDFNVILDENSEVDFIKKLESLAENTGNRINLKILEGEKKDTAPAVKGAKEKSGEEIKKNLASDKYIIIQINLEGDYMKLLNFIHKLETFNYYANIVSIDVVKSIIEEKDPKLNTAYAARNNAEQKIMEKEILQSVITVAVYIKK